jgi:hypothetical protein
MSVSYEKRLLSYEKTMFSYEMKRASYEKECLSHDIARLISNGNLARDLVPEGKGSIKADERHFTPG